MGSISSSSLAFMEPARLVKIRTFERNIMVHIVKLVHRVDQRVETFEFCK